MIHISEKHFVRLEAAGVVFVVVVALFMRNLYVWCDGDLPGILFGAVNNSPWESCKTLLFPYLLWGLLELMTLRLHTRRFVAAKTLSLYALALFYLLMRPWGAEPIATLLSICSAFLMSYMLYNSSLPLHGIFPLAVCLLFLFWVLFFSLTPFPPRLSIFRDETTGMYGIVPRCFDYGAVAQELAP